MNIFLLMFLFAQFEPEPGFGLAILQARQQARNDLVHAILSNNSALAQAALNAKADPQDIIILSQDESQLTSIAQRKDLFLL